MCYSQNHRRRVTRDADASAIHGDDAIFDLAALRLVREQGMGFEGHACLFPTAERATKQFRISDCGMRIKTVHLRITKQRGKNGRVLRVSRNHGVRQRNGIRLPLWKTRHGRFSFRLACSRSFWRKSHKQLLINELKAFSASRNSIPRCAESFFTARNHSSQRGTKVPSNFFDPRYADSFRPAETSIRAPRNRSALPRVLPRYAEPCHAVKDRIARRETCFAIQL